MPLGVWGAVWGRCCPADGLRVFKRLRWLYFKAKSISAKKARIQKNVTLYNFFTFFYKRSWAESVPISWVFRRLWAGQGLRGLYIAPFFANFRYFLIWTSFQAWFSACFPSSAAVLRSVVGAESVKLRQAVRRSGYIYVYPFRYSVSYADFFNLSRIFS